MQFQVVATVRLFLFWFSLCNGGECNYALIARACFAFFLALRVCIFRPIAPFVQLATSHSLKFKRNCENPRYVLTKDRNTSIIFTGSRLAELDVKHSQQGFPKIHFAIFLFLSDSKHSFLVSLRTFLPFGINKLSSSKRLCNHSIEAADRLNNRSSNHSFEAERN